MSDFTLYARLEPTTDPVVLQYVPEKQRRGNAWKDVVLYADRECTQFKARIPAGRKSRPTRRNKWQMLNCFRYRLVWVD